MRVGARRTRDTASPGPTLQSRSDHHPLHRPGENRDPWLWCARWPGTVLAS